MDPHEAREAEIELLKSMYTVGKELIFHDQPSVDFIDSRSPNLKYYSVNRSVDFTLKVIYVILFLSWDYLVPY